MFDLKTISSQKNHSFSCCAECTDPASAQQIRASFIGPVRQIHMFADLYCNGKTLIIESPDIDVTRKIADILNHAIWNLN